VPGLFYSYLVDAGASGFLDFFASNLCCHLFLLRFFLLGSGSLAHTGYALTINLCTLLRTVIQGLLQALAGDVLVRS